MGTGAFSGKQSAWCVKRTHATLRVILNGYVYQSRHISGHHGILSLKTIQFWVYLCPRENFTIFFTFLLLCRILKYLYLGTLHDTSNTFMITTIKLSAKKLSVIF